MAIDLQEIDRLLASLDEQRELSIIKLSEPILSQNEPGHNQDGKYRTSDASISTGGDATDNPTPASLEADLNHYKELFTKLRFSYVEQVTKEKFLRAVVGDPPLYVSHAENTALEAQLLAVKESLKAQKMEVAEMTEELEQQSRELSGRYKSIELQKEQLSNLPKTIENLQETIITSKNSRSASQSDDPVMNLPLNRTLEIVEERESELAALEHELNLLESTFGKKTKELERLQSELRPLEVQRANTVATAQDARRRRDEGLGGVNDDLEQRGRWLKGVEVTMRSLLEAEG